MGLVDTHTHLESFQRNGTLPQALERAAAAGVEAMITIGTSPEDWAMYRDIASERPGFVHYTVGLHPCAVDRAWEESVAQIEEFWNAAALIPVALGECGLDRFHLPKDSTEAETVFAWQRAAFAAQLAIVKRRRCPLVVHSRGAFRETVEMIDDSGADWTRVVFHCFTEGQLEMEELARRGAYASFTGIITYRNAGTVRAAAKDQGLDRFMIETDAPYLAPLPHRGKSNQPAYVRHIAEFAATEVFGVGYDELASATTNTARQFFGLVPAR